MLIVNFFTTTIPRLMSYVIQTGVWTDWSKGRALGATITLSSRDAGLLLAFTAVFVTLIATRFWRILVFVFHQYLVSDGPRDGLHHQRQHIFRNAATPAGAVWLFILQAWHWRGVADKALLRTLPWAAAGGVFVILFALFAVFSSEISEGASEFRLIKPSTCGFFEPVDRDSLQEKDGYDNLQAAIYSRQCYQSSSAMCQELPTVSIQWKNASADCPFGAAVCLDVPSFQMETEMIDSHSHLGINEPTANRISYKRQTTCAPLVTQPGFAQVVRGSEAERLDVENDIFIRYLYGRQLGTQLDIPWTYLYNTMGRNMSIAYSTWTYYSLAGSNTTWRPVEELDVSDGDVSLFLIAPNSIIHLTQNDDPVFSANIPANFGTIGGFQPDRWVSPIACVDRHQICNPTTGFCTPLQGSRQVHQSSQRSEMALNPEQLAIAERLGLNIRLSTFYHVVWTRTQNFLKAQERVAGLTQSGLASNQWEIEMASLFSDALAKLQYQFHEFAAGPLSLANVTVQSFGQASANSTGENENGKLNSALEKMCHKQRVRATQGTLNFSVLWLSILIGLGAFIIIVSFILETVAEFFQTKTGKGAFKLERWNSDEGLQVMKRLFEAKDAGTWLSSKAQFPRTENGEKFHPPN